MLLFFTNSLTYPRGGERGGAGRGSNRSHGYFGDYIFSPHGIQGVDTRQLLRNNIEKKKKNGNIIVITIPIYSKKTLQLIKNLHVIQTRHIISGTLGLRPVHSRTLPCKKKELSCRRPHIRGAVYRERVLKKLITKKKKQARYAATAAR